MLEAHSAVALVAEAADTIAANQDPANTSSLCETRDALLVLTSAGNRLAKLLDGLAEYFDMPELPEPTAAYIALEQAAAAAEDLSASSGEAARAIDGYD